LIRGAVLVLSLLSTTNLLAQPLAGERASSGLATAASAGRAAAAPSSIVADKDYILGPGDILRIVVFGEETLSGQFGVAGNGVVSFPLIGDVPAAGKTVDDVRDEIATALRNGYIKDPRVSAEVLTFRPFFILGEVAKPGSYPYTDGLSVLNAIATAGGFTYRANHKYVFIKRANETVEHKTRLTEDLSVSPGDTVRIAERYF